MAMSARAKSDVSARLIGVGTGPGDPELVTVKAVRVLNAADLVLVPVLALDDVGRAEATVRAHVTHERIQRVVFAMGDSDRRDDAWTAAARTALGAFDRGATTVAFATIGDPNIYSTFTYLAQTVRERRPDVVIETVPGITAMQELAARSGTVLCEGTESLALMPLTAGIDVFDAAITHFDTVVAYKGGRWIGEVADVLREHDRLDSAVYGGGLGLDDEQIAPLTAVLDSGATRRPYLSTVIAPAKRTTKGGKL
jgi:precorrin-2/cobalt-factor-2 C20-methyltransferase